MIHLVYKTTDTTTGQYYIGVHSCRGKFCRHYRKSKQACTYVGSGTRLLNHISKYSSNKIITEIVQVLPDRASAFLLERKLVDLNDPKILNLREGGQAKKDSIPSGNNRKAIFEGVEYPSVTEMALSLGVSVSRASKWSLGRERKGKVGNPKEITIKGVTYTSINQASKILNKDPRSIVKLSKGLELKRASTKPISVNGKYYESTGIASKHLDIHISTVGARCRNPSEKFKYWFYIDD